MDFDNEPAASKVLAYDDIVLYDVDVRSLAIKGGWLTDNVVSFAANYMKNNIIKPENKDKICIVYASVSELLKYCDENIDNSALFKDIGLSPEKWCFFILNDNANPNLAYGGSHWCLLLFDPIKQKFILFDSMLSNNIHTGIFSFARKLQRFLECEAVPLVEPAVRCPQMTISGDCGMFVIEYIQAILNALNKEIRLDSCTIDLSHIDDEYIISQRHAWWLAIKNLKITADREQQLGQ